MIIGITGGIGSGKSTACKILAQNGYRIIDVDAVARKMLEPDGSCYEQVVREFGCVGEDGNIDRRALANAVFGNEIALKKLNSIVHPKVHVEMARLLGEAQGNVVIDCALLIESGYVAMCDKVVLITANKKLRAKRVSERNGIMIKEANARIEAQNDDAYRKHFADATITNAGSEEELQSKLLALIEEK